VEAREHIDNGGQHVMTMPTESRGQVADRQQQAYDELKRGTIEAWLTIEEAATNDWLRKYATLRFGPAIQRNSEQSNTAGWDATQDLREARTGMYSLLCPIE
jgi:hypothetical protein